MDAPPVVPPEAPTEPPPVLTPAPTPVPPEPEVWAFANEVAETAHTSARISVLVIWSSKVEV